MFCSPGRGRASIAASGPDGAIGPRSGPDRAIGRGSGPDGCTLAKAASKAKPAAHYDWWLGLVVCFRAPVEHRLQRGAPLGPDGCKAASQAKPAARCDWWLGLVVCSPGRASGSDGAIRPRSGPDRAIGRGSGPDGCTLAKAASKAKPAAHYDWWLGLVVCFRAPVEHRLQRGAPLGPDGCKAASQAKPAARCDWWLGLVVCSPGRASGSDGAIRPRSGPDGAIGPRSRPDGCTLAAKAASKAKPAVHYDWWLGLLPGPGRTPLAAWGPDRGPTAVRRRLKDAL